MIKLSNVELRAGREVLISGADATVHPKQRIGLVGANGCGKTTLFRALRGDLETDAGSLAYPGDWVISHMAQSIPDLNRGLVDYVLDGDRFYRAAEQALNQWLEAAGDRSHPDEMHANGLAQAQERFEQAGGYQAPARAARLLAGLGFGANQLEVPLSSLSGGWRIRASLAQALMCPCDLLLLDEPTNHLDLETVHWLEGWLKRFDGTLIIISHDRDFLDHTTEVTWHIEQQRLQVYGGSYSQFELERAQRLAQRAAEYKKQQQARQHIQAFVDRFRAKASKARAAQSRLKALARLQQTLPAHVDSPIQFEFSKVGSVAHPMVHFDHVSLGYGEQPVIHDIHIGISPGDRIGLLGVNGAGKSTLIKAIAGALSPLAGTITPARQLKVGYFAQHQLEQLDAQSHPLLELSRLNQTHDLKADDQYLRDFLGGFDFGTDLATRPIHQLSGGQKARLVLALLVFQQPNLLLLDEPTNHLDMSMRQALTVALQAFEGAVLVVSHDRYLLNHTVDQFWLIHQGRLAPFDGDLHDYQNQIHSNTNPSSHETETHAHASSELSHKPDHRQAHKRLQNRLKRLNETLESLRSDIEVVDQEMEIVGQTGDSNQIERLMTLQANKSDLETQLGAVEEEWLSIAQQIEDRR